MTSKLRPLAFLAASVVVLSPSVTPTGLLARGQDALTPREQEIESRRTSQNGVYVGQPKVYDDALLQQMLNAAEARLAAINALDQTGVVAKLGGLSGADQTTTSIALSVQTPSLPQVVTTEKGATSSTVQKEGVADGKTTQSKDTTSGQGTKDVVTTAPQTAVPTATPAASTVALPTGFSVSASDLLNEQMQLTFEIANLRLLLDGALSDRMFTADDKIDQLKPRQTIGFPITIDAEKRFKNAAAIVEVEIVRTKTLAQNADISLTAVLPREKTYNVAAIRESNVSIGGGAITQVVGVGGGFLRARKTYYIVQDQDTIAQTFDPGAANTLGVAWQFKPVLGREYVTTRQTQTFVQLAYPVAFGETDFAKVRIRTYWRRYDRKHGVLKEMIPGSLNETLVGGKPREWNVPNFTPTIPTRSFNATNLEDLGGGQMLVSVPTRLLSGSALRIGSTIFKDGAPTTSFSQSGLRFAASIADLATKRVALIGRDGEEKPLVIERMATATQAAAKPVIARATVVPLDETSSLVEVQMRDDLDDLLPRQIAIIGGKVFGYADAPLVRGKRSLTAVVATSLLQANPSVEVTALFAPAEYRASAVIEGAVPRSQTERLVVVEERATETTFLLYGSRLAGIRILVPRGAVLTPVPGTPAEDSSTVGLLTVKSEDLKGKKHIVLQRPSERPVFVALPTPEPPKKP
jgi:hypothetical protein